MGSCLWKSRIHIQCRRRLEERGGERVESELTGKRYSKFPYPIRTHNRTRKHTHTHTNTIAHSGSHSHMSIERRNETHINQNGRTADPATGRRSTVVGREGRSLSVLDWQADSVAGNRGVGRGGKLRGRGNFGRTGNETEKGKETAFCCRCCCLC